MSAPIVNAEREDKQPEKIERPETLAEQLAFKSRFVLVFGEINHNVARTVCERLIALSQQSDAPIRVLISSPGGHVESGDAIHDMIHSFQARGRILRDYQTPMLGADFHGSRGSCAPPVCSSSTEMLSGERTKAMRPSRGGRLMVTP